MSRIGDIRAGFVIAINAAVTDIQAMNPYPPEQVAVNGTAWLGFFETPIDGYGDWEEHLHRFPLIVIVNRNARIGQATKDTEDAIDTILAAIRALPLPLLGMSGVDSIRYTAYRQGTYAVGTQEYVGFQVDLEIVDRRAVAWA